MRVFVLHGPNLNRLGTRNVEVYGSQTQEDILELLRSEASALGRSDAFTLVQSNAEGELIDALHRAVDDRWPVIMNPAGYTHTSVALRDAVELVTEAGVPVIEVHLSQPAARESFRHQSLIAPVASGTVAGLGAHGYLAAYAALRALDAQSE